MKKEFYESSWLVWTWFVLLSSILGVLCIGSGNFLIFGVFMLVAAYIIVKNYKKPYIEIDPLKIKYENREILWSEIKGMKYVNVGRVMSLILRLKDETVGIELGTLSDSSRRALFDAIEQYTKIRV